VGLVDVEGGMLRLGWGKFVRAWRFALWRGGVNWCLGAEGSL